MPGEEKKTQVSKEEVGEGGGHKCIISRNNDPSSKRVHCSYLAFALPQFRSLADWYGSVRMLRQRVHFRSRRQVVTVEEAGGGREVK